MGPGSEVAGARKDASTPTLSNIPTSFRMATEEMLEKENLEKDDGTPLPTDMGAESAFGVQSLQDTMCGDYPHALMKGQDEEKEESIDSRRRSTLRPLKSTVDNPSEEFLLAALKPGTDTSFFQPTQRHSRQHSLSHSLTSLSVDSQAPLSSMPSSPKSISNRSLRPSDEDSMDESGSQAIVSSSEDDAQPSVENSAPQLVMPSIKMPSRRPFTERGRTMGRLKILLAGDSGVGKTALIKSIVQTCEDIVHVDPIMPSNQSPNQSPKTSRADRDSHLTKSTQQINEVYASTRAYPSWWADVEETRLLRRRKSMGDSVLERNLCFVDTPGHSHGMSKMQGIEAVLKYTESQLERSFSSPAGGESDMVSLLSGNGGSQVDLVLYLFSQEPKHEDMIFLDRLANLTNVIPLLTKIDVRSPEESESLQRSIKEQLRSANIKTFTPVTDEKRQALYSVCSVPGNDYEVMDASLLMSSAYVQPLFPSELSDLMQHLFENETISCLRHLASKKLMNPQKALIPTTTASSPRSPGVSPYLQARITDHIQQEEKLARVKLAKWASELQRSLQAERAQYEATVQSERAGWLVERLEECSVSDKETASPLTTSTVKSKRKRSSDAKMSLVRAETARYNHTNILDAGDPLGILRWNEAMRRRGWLAFQVAGSFGILGAVAVWVAKTWEFGCSCSSSDEEKWLWGVLGGR